MNNKLTWPGKLVRSKVPAFLIGVAGGPLLASLPMPPAYCWLAFPFCVVLIAVVCGLLALADALDDWAEEVHRPKKGDSDGPAADVAGEPCGQ